MSNHDSPSSAPPATVEVRYCAQAGVACGVSHERLPLQSGQTIADLMADLITRHPPLEPLLKTSNERRSRSVLIFVNDQQVDPASREQKLRENDRVMILCPMAGG